MIAPYGHALALAVVLFLMGAACAATRRNLIMILIGVEIMLNAAGLALVAASLHWGKLEGQAFALFVMAAAAAVTAVGLALILHCRRRAGSTDADAYNLMKH